jgi:hypothetical protein
MSGNRTTTFGAVVWAAALAGKSRKSLQRPGGFG